MLPIQRQEMILNLLDEKNSISITALHKKLNVTEMTIRRDLVLLEEKGCLERIRGGAIKTQSLNIEFLFENKRKQMKAEKQAIGLVVTQLMDKNETLFINSGSTVLEVLKSFNTIPDYHMKIITNNPMVTLFDIGLNNELVFLGGEVRYDSYSIVGEFALQMLSQIYATKAIIGVDAINLKNGLTTSNYAEAGVNQKMISQTTGQVIVVADHTKIGRVAPFLSAPIDAVDTLVTTKGIPEEYREQLENRGIRVIIAN
jgi:DeoR family transcriptional regulator, fructose operon transcriptional repressor